MNDRLVNINTPLEPNSDIVIEASTQGEAAVCTLEQLDEYSSSDMKVVVNGRIVRCPKCLEVNGSLELPSYEIKEGDAVETRSFYTVEQLAAFMDVEVDMDCLLYTSRIQTGKSGEARDPQSAKRLRVAWRRKQRSLSMYCKERRNSDVREGNRTLWKTGG